MLQRMSDVQSRNPGPQKIKERDEEKQIKLIQFTDTGRIARL